MTLSQRFKSIQSTMKPIKSIEIEQLDVSDHTKVKTTVSFEDGDFLILYDSDREELNRFWMVVSAQAKRANQRFLTRPV